MDKQKFIELLFKRAEGLISDEESHQLQAWLKASPNHRKYEEKVNEILHRAEKPGKVVDLDLEAEYVRLGSRIKKEDRNLKLKRMRRGFQIAAGFAVLIIALWFLIKPKSTVEFVIKQTLLDVDLADGSKINLAEGSFARFYDEANSRRLQLTGKAYFEIEKHTTRPFIIQTGQGTITVVGTILEVDAGQQAMEVRVKEGHVIVKDATGRDSIHLTAGEGAAWQSDEFIRLESELQPMGAWRLEPVMFSNQPLGEIIPIIEREYQIGFDVADPNLVNCAVTFTLNYPPLPVLIETLETLLDIEILNRGSRQYFIQGSGC